MDADKIDMFMVANGKNLPAEKHVIVREKLQALDNSRYATIASVEMKDPIVMLLISIFLGGLGVDRFMIGNIGLGVLKLLTGGLCGILWLVDIFLIQKKTKELNFSTLVQIL